jgi:hypothetical protein
MLMQKDEEIKEVKLKRFEELEVGNLVVMCDGR